MTPGEWASVKDLFEEALERPASERAGYVRLRAGGDEAVAREVLSLLDAHAEAGDFLGSPTATSAGADAPRPPLPKRVGSYDILRVLGAGGMGIVYLAEQVGPDFRRPVAVKVVCSGRSSSLFVRRFQNERRILAGLSHPNIAALIDGGATEDGLPYFAMEYVAGTPLNEYCDAHRLTTAQRLRLFRTICGAVQYAHQNLVVHRDLKPGNILVTPEGVPKLLDFGVAKVLEPGPDAAPEETAAELRIFTPVYASPEQVKGEVVTTASDVYSLGALLYVLLTGRRPYRVATRAADELARAVLEQDPTRPSLAVRVDAEPGDREGGAAPTSVQIASVRGSTPERLSRALAGDLDTIVLKAMHKDPGRRYASAERLSADIGRQLEGRPVSARPDARAYRLWKFVRRHAAAVVAAGLVVVAVVGGIAATLWQARRAAEKEALAVRRFNDVRKLANAYLFEFHDAIENLAGSTPARQLVVRRGLEYLDGLAREATGDRSLQRELAAAYGRVGDVQGGGHFGNLGDTAGAKASYDKALALREEIARAPGAGPGDRADLVDARLRVSSLLGRAGDHPGATLAARRAVSEAETLADPEPLARAWHRLGQVLTEAGSYGDALACYTKEVAIFEKLSAEQPANARVRHGLAIGYKYVGGLFAHDKKYLESVASYRKALAIEEAFVAAEPANATYRRDLSYTLSDVGYNLLYLGDKKSALENYRRAVGIREALAAADPGDVTLTRALSSIYFRLGLAEVMAGEPGWFTHGQRALALLDGLVKKNPRSVEDRGRRAEMLAGVGELLGLGQTPPWRGTLDPPPPHGACPWHRKSLQAWEELRKEGALSKAQQRQAEYVESLVRVCDKSEAIGRRR
ncbi:MAG: protein kinase domain-containing protein [Acidobacteriota bacterium]